MTRSEQAVPDKARENLDTLRQFEDDQAREASPTQRAIEGASVFSVVPLTSSAS